MAYTLYGMKYNEVKDIINKERSDVFNELIEEVSIIKKGKRSTSTFFIGGMELWGMDTLTFITQKVNHFKSSLYITDTFKVTETKKEYFKIDLLNCYQVEEFKRVGKYGEIIEFLNNLKFPYDWHYEKFYKLGTSFN